MIRNNGNYSEEGNRYEGQVSGGLLTFEGPARFHGLDDEGRIELNGDARSRWPGGCETRAASGRRGCATRSRRSR